MGNDQTTQNGANRNAAGRQTSRTHRESVYKKGAFQGGPISALLFIIFFDTVVKKYEENIPPQMGNDPEGIELSNRRAGKEWARREKVF